MSEAREILSRIQEKYPECERYVDQALSEWLLAFDAFEDPPEDSGVSPIRVFSLTGPPGIGKTHVALSEHTLGGRGKRNVTLTPEMCAADLRMFFAPDASGGFSRVYGAVTYAMLRGERVVINEVSHAGADVLSFLYEAAESSDSCQIDIPVPGGEEMETIRPDPRYQIVFTDNGVVEDLPEAIQDRIEARVQLGFPNPLVLCSVLPEDLATCAIRSLGAFQDGRGVSVRKWISIHEHTLRGFSLDDAVKLATGSGTLSDSVLAALTEVSR